MCPVTKSFTERTVPVNVSSPAYELHVSESQDSLWSTLPQAADILSQDIGYQDIGGVAPALPMKQEPPGVQVFAFDEEQLKIA